MAKISDSDNLNRWKVSLEFLKFMRVEKNATETFELTQTNSERTGKT